MCQKCRVYLYDYFQQPIDKENPLYSFVNHKQLLKNLPELVNLIYYLFFNAITYHNFTDAKSQVDNYCTFVMKSDNPHQQYEMLYVFLNRQKKFIQEIKQAEGLLLDLGFLKFKKTDRTCQRLHQWLAFLFGSLYHDMYVLHKQHTGDDRLWPIELEKGHPGRPDTGVKKNQVTRWIVIEDNEDDLYT